MVVILMATYNGEKYISTQLESIFNQNYSDINISIIDDCSTDNTFEIVNSFSGEPRLKSIEKNGKNVKIPGINFFNLLNKHINDYEYFAFADQDDYWDSEKLNIAITKLESSNSDFYCSELKMWDGLSDNTTLSNKKGQIKLYDHLFESASAGCTCVITKQLANKIVKITQSPDFVYWESFSHDWFMYFVARINGLKYYFDNNSYIKYRLHGNNFFGVASFKNPQSVIFRLRLLKNGWYRAQLSNMVKYIPNHNCTEYKIVNSLLGGSFYNRAKIVMLYGRNLRRHFAARIILQFMILMNQY